MKLQNTEETKTKKMKGQPMLVDWKNSKIFVAHTDPMTFLLKYQ